MKLIIKEVSTTSSSGSTIIAFSPSVMQSAQKLAPKGKVYTEQQVRAAIEKANTLLKVHPKTFSSDDSIGAYLSGIIDATTVS